MKYAKIKPITIENGDGIRVSLFVSGCRNLCPGCFNTCAKSFDYGENFTQETIDYILKLLEPDYVQGLTILGGEPFEPENQVGILPLIEQVKETFPTKDIWCYSGYVYDKDLISTGRKYVKNVTDKIFSMIDVLIDGPYIEKLKNLSLQYRGSSNQRVLRKHIDF